MSKRPVRVGDTLQHFAEAGAQPAEQPGANAHGIGPDTTDGSLNPNFQPEQPQHNPAADLPDAADEHADNDGVDGDERPPLRPQTPRPVVQHVASINDGPTVQPAQEREPTLQECNARYQKEERERAKLKEENLGLLETAFTKEGKRVLKNLRSDRAAAVPRDV